MGLGLPAVGLCDDATRLAQRCGRGHAASVTREKKKIAAFDPINVDQAHLRSATFFLPYVV